MPTSSPALQVDQTTVFSLLGTVAVLATAYGFSLRVLPRHSGTTARVLFVWHLFDGLIHLIFEGSFLWNCFFVHAPYNPSAPSEFLPPNVHFLDLHDSIFGAAYGAGPFSKLWQEYAKADRRWGGTDLTVISLEILTVFIGGPLALWCAEMVRRGEWNAGRRAVDNKKWFWMILLATGELYGGWMTFAPEWLSGSPNLVTSNFLYKWVYLFFFNTLWVWVPLWIIVKAYKGITGVTTTKEGRVHGSKEL